MGDDFIDHNGNIRPGAVAPLLTRLTFHGLRARESCIILAKKKPCSVCKDRGIPCLQLVSKTHRYSRTTECQVCRINRDSQFIVCDGGELPPWGKLLKSDQFLHIKVPPDFFGTWTNMWRTFEDVGKKNVVIRDSLPSHEVLRVRQQLDFLADKIGAEKVTDEVWEPRISPSTKRLMDRGYDERVFGLVQSKGKKASKSKSTSESVSTDNASPSEHSRSPTPEFTPPSSHAPSSSATKLPHPTRRSVASRISPSASPETAFGPEDVQVAPIQRLVPRHSRRLETMAHPQPSGKQVVKKRTKNNAPKDS